ncbi:MAG: hypothetical protein WA324_26900 [Bryobacteraceae bacterium]
MGHIPNPLKIAKDLLPKISASPLHAPSIIRQYFFGPKAVAALQNLLNTSSDGSGQGPQWSGSYTNMGSPYASMGPKNGGYTSMGNGNGGSGYQSMGAGNGNAGYTSMGAGNGNARYETMATNGYAVMDSKPSYTSMGAGPAGGGLMNGMGGQSLSTSGVLLPNLNTIPQLPMGNGHLQSDQQHRVKYVSDPATLFMKYEVEINKDIKRRGVPLDTKQIKEHFIDKDRSQIGVAMLGRDAQEQAKLMNLVLEWGETSLIWVCVKAANSQDPVFFSHVGKKDRFHHSSFTCGGDVIGAGEWIVQGGRLLKISANSGHYRPPMDYFYRAVLFMSTAWRTNTTVMLWNTTTDNWEDVPIQNFKSNPTGGGKYKTHPLS